MILTGEFAVTLGADCLILPIERQMRGYSKVCEGKGRLFIGEKQVEFERRQFDEETIESLAEIEGTFESKIFCYLYSYFIGNKAFPFDAELRIESDIPQKQGLGSSAAYCLTLVKWFEVRL